MFTVIIVIICSLPHWVFPLVAGKSRQGLVLAPSPFPKQLSMAPFPGLVWHQEGRGSLLLALLPTHLPMGSSQRIYPLVFLPCSDSPVVPQCPRDNSKFPPRPPWPWPNPGRPLPLGSAVYPLPISPCDFWGKWWAELFPKIPVFQEPQGQNPAPRISSSGFPSSSPASQQGLLFPQGLLGE